jgi:hypothetical protein
MIEKNEIVVSPAKGLIKKLKKLPPKKCNFFQISIKTYWLTMQIIFLTQLHKLNDRKSENGVRP